MRKAFLISLISALLFVTPTSVLASHRIKFKTDQVVNVPFFIEDSGGGTPSDPATILYETRLHNKILAPDGHHVTLDEFNAVYGKAKAECSEEGTKVKLSLRGLIPHGVYTIWNVTFNSPGFDPTFANLSGVGAAGAIDGSQNSFVASSHGRAHISMITPGGNLSMLGSIGNCALTDEFEWHIVGAYHLDGQTHGGNLGPDGTAVEQFGFILNSP